MSWKNKIENKKFTIKTGDGKVYKPLWKNGEKTKDFNYSKYDFINQKGSFVDRKNAQSNSFPLVFWFVGDDNIEVADEFEKSASDSRRWIISHPLYGTIKGQPINLTRNDNNYGASEISVRFWESIDANYPEGEDSIIDVVKNRVRLVNSLASANYVARAKPSTSDIPNIKSSIEIISANFKPDAKLFNDFKQTVSTALKSVDNLVSKTEIAINSTQSVLSSPARFRRSITDKIRSIKSSYNELKTNIDNKQSKHYFESQGATLIGNFSESSVTPLEDDYITKADVEYVNAELLSLYSDYLATLDQVEVSRSEINDVFVPDVQLQQELVNLVTYTSKSLFVLSFEAKQARTYILKKDTNLIILTHKFLGLDAKDKNIERFKSINNISLNEIYTIKKGREITYYV